MKGILLGFFSLLLYLIFSVSALFIETDASSSGEIEPLKIEAKTDYLETPEGNFTEIYRPPVYIGISPGGPPNHIIKLNTGVIKQL